MHRLSVHILYACYVGSCPVICPILLFPLMESQDIVEEDEDAFAKGKKNGETMVPAMSETQAEAKKAVSTL